MIDRRLALFGPMAVAIPAMARAFSPLQMTTFPNNGGGSVPSLNVTQFFDRLITPPTAARQLLYSASIDALTVAGVWSKLDVLYFFAAADANTSTVNLISGSYKATLISSENSNDVFTADRGWAAIGVNDCVNSNFNPSTAAGNYMRNDAMIGIWNLQTGQSNGSMCFFQSGGGNSKIKPRTSFDQAGYDINSNGTDIVVSSVTDASGWWVAERTASNVCTLSRNNAVLDTNSAASIALINENLVLMGGTGRQGAIVAIGGSLTGAQKTALFNVGTAYLTGVGAI